MVSQASPNPDKSKLPAQLQSPGAWTPGTLPETVSQARVPGTPSTLSALTLSGGAPRRFGEYLLLEEVAKGGMGVVFRAHDHRLHRQVALKMMRSGMLSSDEEVERFYREARAAAGLSHPNIIGIYQVGQCEGLHYFTMALAADTLSRRLDQYKADPHKAVALLEKVARGVHHAHTKGVLHRDLKPSNILLDDRGEPLVSDFGIAKLVAGNSELTTTGRVFGTPAYMPPEQADGRSRAVSGQADVWSLGVILYELLVGQRPFTGETDELLSQIREADPPRPRLMRSGLDRDLETVVLKCLEKSPDRRYASAEALADDLARWLRGEAVLARPTRWPVRAWRKVARRPLRSASIVLVCLGLAALAIMPHLTDPKRELYRTQARLARGEAAVLVPATGLPPWYAWQTGQEASTLSTESDGATTLHSWTTGLLELVEDPGHERFRLSAEIRHQDSTSGLAGLYFFYTLQEQAAVREHFMAALQFNDRELEGLPGEDGTVQNPLSLRLWRWLDPPPPDGQLNLASQSMHLRQFVPAVQRAGASLGIWRKLEIEFAPEQLRVRFDGQECPLVDAAKLQRHVARLVNERPALAGQPPRFSPRQPLGLFVYRGSVSFRNVVISPLPEQP